MRNHLPNERNSITHKFQVGELEGYIIVGLYPNGDPGEVFLTIQKPGTVERGLADALAIMISLALQSGVPLVKIAEKLRGLQFEPRGLTKNPQIPLARSVADYIGQWLEKRFVQENKANLTSEEKDL